MYDYDDGLDTGRYFFQRWPTAFPDSQVFSNDAPPSWNDVIQGDLGNCYFLAAVGAAAEFPELLYDLFDDRTEAKNDAGIYQVMFYIRGKPWVVDVDDQLLFEYPDTPWLKFAKPFGA